MFLTCILLSYLVITVQVDESMRVTAGGGVEEHGELIEVGLL